MREYTSPGAVEIAPSDNLVRAFASRADVRPEIPAFSYRDGDRFVDVITSDAVEQVRELAAGLVALGIQPGDRVAIFSATRMEYSLLQLAIWAAGAALVTIYETSSPEQVRWIMGDSGAVGIFCETETLRKVFEEVADSLPECRHTFVIDDGALAQVMGAATAESREEARRRTEALAHDDLAMLIYTSGTTGRPKGCMITHYNLIYTVRNAIAALPDLFGPRNSTLVFLPLAHSFAQAVQAGAITGEVKTGFSTGVPNLVEELSMFKPRWVTSVPRVFEKVYNGAKQKADAEGKGKIFDIGAKVAERYSRAERPSLPTKLLHGVFDKLLYGKLREIFGGNLVYAISGGAALGERLGHFFRGIGLTVLEGYGLTETTAITVYNRPEAIKIGTVGRPTPGTSIRIADDGEILIKGGGVFKGYWNNPEATAEVFDEEGWFHTGDIGELDDDGYLRITGRKKEILVTAGGKNVAPAVLEDRLRAHPLISQCMVVGDGKPFIAALITLDPEGVAAWAEMHDKPTSVEDLLDDPDLNAEIQKAIDDANQLVSRAESIRAYRILPEDFTIEGGELTPTFKVKRGYVAKKWQHVIDEIYGD